MKKEKKNNIKEVAAAEFVSEAEATVALNAAAEFEFKAILVSTTPPFGVRYPVQCRRAEGDFHLSCIFSRIGTIMSNLGLFAGSSFMHIFMSLQMWGEMPGGIVGLKPSKAT